MISKGQIYLDSIEKDGIKLGLDRMRDILKLLDFHSSNEMVVIHVAGTNGKGSIANLLAYLLQSEGFKVGVYSSPHLIHVRERIRIQQQCISKDLLDHLVVHLQKKIGSIKPTYFEVLTILAMMAFHDQKVDFAILEVGLGGRLDATNVFDSSIQIFGKIDFDHTKILGDHLTDIAIEKAAIIKKKSKVYSTVQDESVDQVLAQKSAEMGSIYHSVAKIVESVHSDDEKNINYVWKNTDVHVNNFKLLGHHQAENLSVALEVFRDILAGQNKSIPAQINFNDFIWPARSTWISDHILVEGAHNPGSIDALVRTVKSLPWVPNVILFGAIFDKDWEVMLDLLSNLNSKMIFVSFQYSKAIPADLLQIYWKKKYPQLLSHKFNCIKDAMNAVNPGDEKILITGSLYMIGEFLSHDYFPMNLQLKKYFN